MYRRQASWASVNSESPYPGATSSPLLQARYSLHPDPSQWGVALEDIDADDELHKPEPQLTHDVEFSGTPLSFRGLTNLGCLFILVAGILALFIGYPVLSFRATELATTSSLGNLGGRNGTGQVPDIGNWGLIDATTPEDAYTVRSWNGGEDMELVFSDEFTTDGRTFYPGDDPFWEAVDLHYWATNNLEWYDPASITTSGGNLVITLSEKQEHDLEYSGGMLATWNKFCFTGGYIETRVQLPGFNNVQGLWPAVWTLGNLGRAGYGASLEGLWPYTYDACDVGTAPNQTHDGGPPAALVDGDTGHDGELSWLPGQRLSACTCPGENHPGPARGNGFVGRAAPEIDVFEAQITSIDKVLVPQVSQSAQWAPFDAAYEWQNTTEFYSFGDPSLSHINSFKGSITQQATSVLTSTDPTAYERNGGAFSVYGFEYKPGFNDAYITWVSNNKMSWTMRAGGVGANELTQISARPVPQEPMYIIANLGMSRNFGNVDLAHIQFPVQMKIDYIRVYQPRSAVNIGCDPKDFPTQAYINQYIDAYTNPNFTSWSGDYHQPWPKSSFLGQC